MIFGIVIASAAGLILCAALGFVIIPWLRRMKYGQTILDIGPAWHKNKQGTPTMGGIMIILAAVAAFAMGIGYLFGTDIVDVSSPSGRINLFRATSGLIMAVCLAFVGFLDDFIKVKKKRNEGLTSNQKLILQVLIIAAYLTARYMSGDVSTVIKFPLLGDLDLWLFYYVIMGLGMLYLVNAVNLTDGVDGLCPGVTVVFTSTYIIICGMLGFAELQVLSAAVAGALIGFLFWNFHPAKVFMGDTGSMFLGGIVCALGIGSGTEVLMVIAGAVYIWEALTVLIQTTYFKLTHGKRLFKMTPIHHSFELSGWKETGILALFAGLTAVAGCVAVILAQYY
jgi:phospho-N-acetylmuramoyl-pentapeptide-transferase